MVGALQIGKYKVKYLVGLKKLNYYILGGK